MFLEVEWAIGRASDFYADVSVRYSSICWIVKGFDTRPIILSLLHSKETSASEASINLIKGTRESLTR